MLPPELFELIFAGLSDEQDLRACALLSSAFLPLARRRLFTHLILFPARSLNPCLKLLRLLSASPYLVQYISSLSIIDGRLFPSLTIAPSLGITTPFYHNIRDKLNNPPWVLTTPPNILISLFQTLSNTLRSFSLIFQDGPQISWDTIPNDTQRAFTHLFTGPSLRSLHLQRISFNTPSSFLHFTDILSTGHLTTLKLHTVTFNHLLSTTTTTTTATAFHQSRARPSKELTSLPLTHRPPSFSHDTRSSLKLENLSITSCSSCASWNCSDDYDLRQAKARVHIVEQDPDTTLNLLKVLLLGTSPHAAAVIGWQCLCGSHSETSPESEFDTDTLARLTCVVSSRNNHKASTIHRNENLRGIINPRTIRRISLPCIHPNAVPEVIDLLRVVGVEEDSLTV